jgi:orotate phosphoribosyltransferase
VPPGSKRLPSYKAQGTGYYTWQFYLRAALFNPIILSIVVFHFLDLYEDTVKSGEVQLCGVESASTPILTGIMLECCRRGYAAHVFSIRKERKAYGLENWIEGRVLDRPAMLVDDVISPAHKTAIHGAQILADHNIRLAPIAYAVLFKAKEPERGIKLTGIDVTVRSLFDLNDFNLSLQSYKEAIAPKPVLQET